MHSAVQTADVTIISYKSLSDLNFARYTQQHGSYMPSSPLEFISPWFYYAVDERYIYISSQLDSY